jgi:hypothetical protein
MPGEDAWRPVGQTESGNTQPRNAAYIASLALIVPRIFAAIVKQYELLIEGHFAQQPIDAAIARYWRKDLRQGSIAHKDGRQKRSGD